MANFIDKVKVNTAIVDNTKLDLSSVHMTTANWMQANPVFFKECVPGEKINVNVETFARMNPLPVPTFGRGNIKVSKFFVPYRTIFKAFNDFITDSYHISAGGSAYSNLVNSVPTVSNATLLQCILSYSVQVGTEWTTFAEQANSGATSYDINLRGSKYILTQAGRQAMKVLESLGYKINWNTDDTTSYSALPLLAYAKIYMDYYFPAQYTNSVIYNTIQALTNFDAGSTSLVLSALDVSYILSMCIYVCYDSDYFVSAWDNPNSPNNGNYSGNYQIRNLDTIGEITVPSTAITAAAMRRTYVQQGYVTNNNGISTTGNTVGYADAPFISPYVPGTTSTGSMAANNVPLSEYLLHSLHALTDFMKRNQISSRAMDRYLARYGKVLDCDKMNRSIYLGTDIVPLQISDVMSLSDTVQDSKGQVLGGYAGKGLAYANGDNADFSTDEYGLFIIVSSIVPKTGYFQGIDRTVKHIYRTDFWIPEFDSLGVQAISADELYIPQDYTTEAAAMSGTSANEIHEQVFGFIPRYAEYKCSRDRLTGNFRVPSLNGASSEYPADGSSSWHLMRDMEGRFQSVSGMVHNPEFVYGISDAGQYNRVFYNPDQDAPDQFIMIYNFDVTSYSPMKPLYDSYEFEDKGKTITLTNGGTQIN